MKTTKKKKKRAKLELQKITEDYEEEKKHIEDYEGEKSLIGATEDH